MKPKKRLRLSISCERCRKRKIKCDHGRPCGNCIKRHAVTECVYSNTIRTKKKQGQISKKELFEEVCFLRSENEILKRETRKFNNASTLERSKCASANFDSLLVKDRIIFHSVSTSRLSVLRGDSGLASFFKKFSKTAMKPNFKDILTDANGLHVECSGAKALRSSLNATNEMLYHQLASSITAYKLKHQGNLLGQQEFKRDVLIRTIEGKLPSIFIINALVHHFFTKVYYLLPYIDEEAFRSELKLSINSKDHGKQTVLNPKARIVFIVLFLLVIRFAYIAIPEGQNVEEIEDENARVVAISGAQIEPELVELARQLLFSQDGEFGVFRRVTLSSIQCLLYFYLYQGYAPEINEETPENSIFVDMLVRMSLLVGLNRDPNVFPLLLENESIKILWRRIFYQILWIDTLNAFNFGGLPRISEGYYDVKLPDLTENEKTAVGLFERKNVMSQSVEKLKHILLQREINASIAANYNMCLLLHRMLSYIHRIDIKVEYCELMEFADQLIKLKHQYCPETFSLYGSTSKSQTKHVDTIFSVPKCRLLITSAFVYMHVNTFAYLAFDVATNIKEKELASRKASQAADCLFKLCYDFASILSNKDDEHSCKKRLNSVCGDLQNLVFVKINNCFERVLFWFISRSIREFEQKESLRMSDETVQFDDSADLTEVKLWLTKSKSGVFQCMISRFKDYYLALTKLEARFFIAWRNKVKVTFLFRFIKHKCGSIQDEKIEAAMRGTLVPKIGSEDNVHSNSQGDILSQAASHEVVTSNEAIGSSSLPSLIRPKEKNLPFQDDVGNIYEGAFESSQDFDHQIKDLFGEDYDLNLIYGSDDLISLMGLGFK